MSKNTIGECMSGVVINSFGGPEVLSFRSDIPQPAIGPNQVLIKTSAAGINPLDFYIREGKLSFFIGRRFPQVIGNDLSGYIVAVGSAVRRFKKGDRVFCMNDGRLKGKKHGFAQSGAYAGYCVTREDTLALLPANISEIDAAAIPLAGLTSYQALKYVAKAKKGQSVLINGASGGVGTLAVQIAKAMELEVTAVCKKESFELVKSLGADKVIDYTTTDFTARQELYDIIFDVAVTKSFRACKKVLKSRGIYISNLATAGAMGGTFFYSLKKLLGFEKKHTYNWVTPSGSDLADIAALITAGKVVPVVDKTFPLRQARQAHEYCEQNRVKGKVVLIV